MASQEQMFDLTADSFTLGNFEEDFSSDEESEEQQPEKPAPPPAPPHVKLFRKSVPTVEKTPEEKKKQKHVSIRAKPRHNKRTMGIKTRLQQHLCLRSLFG